MRRRRQPRHVVPCGGFVADLGQHHHGNIQCHGGAQRLGRNSPHGHVRRKDAKSLRHIDIRWKVPRLGQDHPPPRPRVQACRQELIDIGRCGISDHHFMRRRADQAGDFAPHPPGGGHPAGVVPAADQAFAPLSRHRISHRRCCRGGQRPQRVSVQINHTRRQSEAVPKRPQGVCGVQGEDIVGSRGHGRQGEGLGHRRKEAADTSNPATHCEPIPLKIMHNNCPLGGRSADLRQICCNFLGHVLAASWPHPGNIWQHVCSRLATFWLPIGHFVATLWKRSSTSVQCRTAANR